MSDVVTLLVFLFHFCSSGLFDHSIHSRMNVGIITMLYVCNLVYMWLNLCVFISVCMCVCFGPLIFALLIFFSYIYIRQ